jgi:signal transduction histidine kinase/CheY-like chemotaxis protein
VSGTGAVQWANSAARLAFQALVQPGATFLAALVLPNQEAVWETLLARLEAARDRPGPLTVRKADGTVAPFTICAARVQSENQPIHLFQLFEQTGSEASPAAFNLRQVPGPGPHESASVEAGLAQKQKLDCALQLTRTVALDFNNALTSILGHTSLILSKMEPSHPWRSSLVEIEKSAEKAAEVASDLAAFSRQEKATRSQMAGNLNDLVRRTVELFRGPSSRPVLWTLQLEPKLHTTTFEEAKMQQAFVKILDNAIQSIGDNGRIVARTRNQSVMQPVQEGNVTLVPGEYVCVEFEDNGCGIAPEILPRVFEPFFTTKPSPAHRGLGLAWVYGIVTNHGGSVGVSSQVGRGTAVRVYLPAQKKIVRDRASLDTGDLRGSETLLMIDDEELLLTMGEMVLSSFGYRVLTAGNGQQALEVFRQHRREIDLVITDLVMPKMSGRELIEQLRQLDPAVKVICSSGYVRALQANEEELYLQKPFTSMDLLRTVKQALTPTDAS